jgi:hypothetical protein
MRSSSPPISEEGQGWGYNGTSNWLPSFGGAGGGKKKELKGNPLNSFFIGFLSV